MDREQVMQTAREKGKGARQYAGRGFVNFVTNDKVITAFLTGASFKLIEFTVATVAVWVTPLIPISNVDIAQLQVQFFIMVWVAYFWYWADGNKEQFEIFLSDAVNKEEDRQSSLGDY